MPVIAISRSSPGTPGDRGPLRPVLLVAFMACLVALGACATQQRFAFKPDTISIYSIVGPADEHDPAMSPSRVNAMITLEELNELGARSGSAVEHLVDAPISDGAFSADATAAVSYAAVNPDGSTSAAVLDRRSGCSLKGTVAGRDGVYVLSYDLYYGVVRSPGGQPRGSPPMMDSRRLVSLARITAGVPCILGAMENAAGNGASGSQGSGRQSLFLVLLLGPHP